MARRRGLVATLAQLERETSKAHAARVRAQLAAQRGAERSQNALERARLVDEKEHKRLYLESRVADVDAMNAEIEYQVAVLEGLLDDTLAVDDHIDFDALKVTVTLVPYYPGRLAVEEPATDWSTFAVAEPTGAKRFVPGAKDKHAATVAAAKQRYQAEFEARAEREQQRISAGVMSTRLTNAAAPRWRPKQQNEIRKSTHFEPNSRPVTRTPS